MTSELYEQVRRNLFGGHHQNAFVQLLRDRAAVTGPVQGTPEEFSQLLYELTGGDVHSRNRTVSYEAVAGKSKDILKFADG